MSGGARMRRGPEPDDPERPVTLRLLTAFERLRRGLAAPERIPELLDSLGFAPLPVATGGSSGEALAAISVDGVLWATVQGEPMTGQMVATVSARAAEAPEIDEALAMLEAIYGLGHAGEIEPADAIAGGALWFAVIDGLALSIEAVEMDDGSLRLIGATDGALRMTVAEAGPDALASAPEAEAEPEPEPEPEEDRR